MPKCRKLAKKAVLVFDKESETANVRNLIVLMYIINDVDATMDVRNLDILSMSLIQNYHVDLICHYEVNGYAYMTAPSKTWARIDKIEETAGEERLALLRITEYFGGISEEIGFAQG